MKINLRIMPKKKIMLKKPLSHVNKNKVNCFPFKVFELHDTSFENYEMEDHMEESLKK